VEVETWVSADVTWKLIFVAEALVADSIRVGIDVAVADLLGPRSSYKIPFIVASERAATTAVVGSTLVTDGEALGFTLSSDVIVSANSGGDRRDLLVSLVLTSLKDTNAFSVLQETLFILKIAMIVTGSRTMLNLFSDSSNKMGSALPMVAFDSFLIKAVVQLSSPAIVHREPV
jgi:hypothetical protein